MNRIEDTSAVSKPTLVAREVDESIGFQIESADINNGVCHFLPISSHILYRSAANGTRYTSKTLYPADSLLADLEHKGVPVSTSCYGAVHKVVVIDLLDRSIDGDVKDKAVETGVTNQQVASAPKDEDGHAVLVSEFDGLSKSGFCIDLAEVAGGSADAESSVGSQWYGFLNSDRGTLHGFEGTTPECGSRSLSVARNYTAAEVPNHE